ncbi:MAG TPA: methionine gamma-lyase family protein [Clostridia bacterium]|nr:methionine gamma-lyase family protein [Clostridia bacterium]
MIVTERELTDRAQQLEIDYATDIAGIRALQRRNFMRVLSAFHTAGIATSDLRPMSGYGIGDSLREKTEHVFALLYGAQAALVRPQIISGTHALAIALFGVLRPGDLLCCVTGAPYDTMEEIIGIRPSDGSLAEFGVRYTQCDLTTLPPELWEEQLAKCFSTQMPRLVLIQRSRGYKRIRALREADIAHMIACVKRMSPDTLVLVDNCYGDLLEDREPTMDGADLLASSFMKNVGAGIVPTGGYVVGTSRAVALAATRYSSPGVGSEIGPNLGFAETFLRGLLFAPIVMEQVLVGSLLASALLQENGFVVDPGPHEPRGDIVLRIECRSRGCFTAFARAVQECSALDADAVPEASPMQGYDREILMAGGTLVQGSTVELSFDGPACEPYVGYLQGGLNAWQVVQATARGIAYSMNAHE